MPRGAVVQTAQTDVQGKYTFTNLAPGAYSVRETQPTGYYQGGQSALVRTAAMPRWTT